MEHSKSATSTNSQQIEKYLKHKRLDGHLLAIWSCRVASWSSLISPCSSLVSPCSSLVALCSSLINPSSSLLFPCSPLVSTCSLLMATRYPLVLTFIAFLFPIPAMVTVILYLKPGQKQHCQTIVTHNPTVQFSRVRLVSLLQRKGWEFVGRTLDLYLG